MAQQAMGGASRFMGGNFRAYTVAVREVRHGWPPLVVVITLQRRCSSSLEYCGRTNRMWHRSQLYYLLGVVEEDYGTAFAINLYGAMVFDFGLLGCLIGAAVIGLLLQLGDSAIPSWRELGTVVARPALAVLRDDVGLLCGAAVGVRYSGGDRQRIGLTAAFLLVQTCSRTMHAVLVAASDTRRREAAA